MVITIRFLWDEKILGENSTISSSAAERDAKILLMIIPVMRALQLYHLLMKTRLPVRADRACPDDVDTALQDIESCSLSPSYRILQH